MNLDNLKIKSVVFDKENETTLICKSVDEIFAYEDPSNLLVDIASLLDGQHSFDEICENLNKNDSAISVEDLSNILENVFIDNNLILNNFDEIILSDRAMVKYDRLIHFFAAYDGIDYLQAQKMQKKLFDSNILILGVGGTGGHTAHSLIASGVGKMTLLDFDNVELTNVTRQMLYSEKDIGLPKIEIAKSRLLEINPDADIETISENIVSPEQLKKIVVGGILILLLIQWTIPEEKLDIF